MDQYNMMTEQNMGKVMAMMAKMREGKKLNKKELIILYVDIMDQMYYLYRHNMLDTKEGKVWQKHIVSRIDAYPEVLHIQTKSKNNKTIGMRAVSYGLFYVTMRAIEDVKACMLKDDDKETIFDKLKGRDAFRNRVINSQEYERLIERLEARLAGKEEPKYEYEHGVINDKYDDFTKYDTIINEDKNEDMNEYDSIME